MAGKKKVKSGRLTVVNADCAGVDVGKSYHYVAVDPERFENPVRKFGSFTSDLGALAQWALGMRGKAGGDGVDLGVLDPDVRGSRPCGV